MENQRTFVECPGEKELVFGGRKDRQLRESTRKLPTYTEKKHMPTYAAFDMVSLPGEAGRTWLGQKHSVGGEVLIYWSVGRRCRGSWTGWMDWQRPMG